MQESRGKGKLQRDGRFSPKVEAPLCIESVFYFMSTCLPQSSSLTVEYKSATLETTTLSVLIVENVNL